MEITINLSIKFLSSLKSIIGKDQLTIIINSNEFTVEDLLNKLANELGQNFENLIINKKNNTVNPEILIFVDDKEIHTLQNLKTPLSDRNQITFLSSIHGGFIMKT